MIAETRRERQAEDIEEQIRRANQTPPILTFITESLAVLEEPAHAEVEIIESEETPEKPFSQAELGEIDLLKSIGVAEDVACTYISKKRELRREKAKLKPKQAPKFRNLRIEKAKYKAIEEKAKDRNETIEDLFFSIITGL